LAVPTHIDPYLSKWSRQSASIPISVYFVGASEWIRALRSLCCCGAVGQANGSGSFEK